MKAFKNYFKNIFKIILKILKSRHIFKLTVQQHFAKADSAKVSKLGRLDISRTQATPRACNTAH